MEAAVAVVVRAGVEDHVGLLHAGEVVVRCVGRKPPFLAIKHPARPYKSAIQNRFTVKNANDAYIA